VECHVGGWPVGSGVANVTSEAGQSQREATLQQTLLAEVRNLLEDGDHLFGRRPLATFLLDPAATAALPTPPGCTDAEAPAGVRPQASAAAGAAGPREPREDAAESARGSGSGYQGAGRGRTGEHSLEAGLVELVLPCLKRSDAALREEFRHAVVLQLERLGAGLQQEPHTGAAEALQRGLWLRLDLLMPLLPRMLIPSARPSAQNLPDRAYGPPRYLESPHSCGAAGEANAEGGRRLTLETSTHAGGLDEA
ncbi:hypothetical protein CYMTET_6265, partial [Cymbomonas tetramitiformis]